MQRFSSILLVTILAYSSGSDVAHPKHAHAEHSYMRREAVLGHKAEALHVHKKHTGTGAHSAARSHISKAHLSHLETRIKHAGAKKKHAVPFKPKKASAMLENAQTPPAATAPAAPAAGTAPAATAPAATAKAAAVPTDRPVQLVPAAGQEVAINSAAKMVKDFTLTFWVKFNSFAQNDQILLSTDMDAFTIQALGPKYGENATKLMAWMKTDSGLGPDGHGVAGSDGHGRLLSASLSTGKWYFVEFKKTPSRLSLAVDRGTPAFSNINPKEIIKSTDFDLEAGSTKVFAGKKAGSGDIGLDGSMGDVTLVEGPAAVPAVATASSGSAPAATAPAPVTAAKAATVAAAK